MRTRVKICGITRREDALAAARLGVDAIGLVFYPPSPRAVTVEQARQIVDALPPFVTVVGLFVNPEPEQVTAVDAQVGLDLLQFHGDETPEFCNGFGRPYIKAVRMREDVDLQRVAEQYASARGLLLDTYRPGVAGGTGEAFDWTRVPEGLAGAIILAGGLNPQNVGQAIAAVQPYAVDVSGGVEAAKGVAKGIAKGIKDAAKITAFMQGVESADAN